MNIYDQMLENWDDTQWIQHTTNLQQQCIGGRLALELGHDKVEPVIGSAEWKHLTDTIRQHTNNRYISIQQWNDEPNRKFDHIETILTIASVKWDLDHEESLV